MRSDFKQEMDGIEQRSYCVNIVRSFVVSSCPRDIRDMFGIKEVENTDYINEETYKKYDHLINVIMQVLVHIAHRTLAEDKKCDMKDIINFLDNIIPTLPSKCHVTDSKRLAAYIVVNVLQNNGNPFEYEVYDSREERYKKTYVRLIRESEHQYFLENDAFDFLFRSKELGDEYEYEIDTFRLIVSMKHQNYQLALRTSQNLLYTLRHMMNLMDSYIQRCRENIHKVDKEEYEKIISSYSDIISSEQKELKEIKKNAEKKVEDLKKVINKGIDDENTKENKQRLMEVVDNLSVILRGQRELINKKNRMSEIYLNLIKDSFSISLIERMNFDKDIMRRLRNTDVDFIPVIRNFLSVLKTPELPRFFNIEQYYEAVVIKEEGEEEGIDIDNLMEDKDNETVKLCNEIYCEIMLELFYYMSDHHSFVLEDFINSLSEEKINKWTQMKLLQNVFSSMFNQGFINMEIARKNMGFEPHGKFDFLWCLSQIPDSLKVMKEIRIEPSEDCFIFYAKDGENVRRFEWSNLRIEVGV